MTAAKLLFAGTPEFALESLRALHAAGRAPLAVLTQPDRPAGRGRKPAASPVKEFASRAGIPVWQPPTLLDDTAVAEIAAVEPDLMIVAAYGLILPCMHRCCRAGAARRRSRRRSSRATHDRASA